MEHNGTEFSVVQTANPTGWKWTVQIAGRKIKTGFYPNRARAIVAAKIAIENANRYEGGDKVIIADRRADEP